MMPELNRHMEEEEIERYSMGVLSEAEEERAEQHLLICESCQALVKQEDAFTQAMRKAGTELEQEKETPRVPWWRRPIPALALAAVVALLVIAGLRFSPSSSAAPVAVGLQATRGETNLAKAPAGRQLTLELDVTTLEPQASYAVDVVDQGGIAVWKGTAKLEQSKLAVGVPRLGAGVYFVRVYSADGQLLREYGLEVSG